jgi:acetyl-CoA carboxylase beta subunit
VNKLDRIGADFFRCVDMIVDRRQMKAEIAKLLAILQKQASESIV